MYTRSFSFSTQWHLSSQNLTDKPSIAQRETLPPLVTNHSLRKVRRSIHCKSNRNIVRCAPAAVSIIVSASESVRPLTANNGALFIALAQSRPTISGVESAALSPLLGWQVYQLLAPVRICFLPLTIANEQMHWRNNIPGIRKNCICRKYLVINAYSPAVVFLTVAEGSKQNIVLCLA